jgi:hypothetical protein
VRILASALAALLAVLALAASPASAEKLKHDPRVFGSCPATKSPLQPFVPPLPYPRELDARRFWIGTNKLWTDLPFDGVWRGSSHKIFWWREDYDWRKQNPPQFTVRGRRLDGAAHFLERVRGNAGWTNDANHPFMVVAFDLPTDGCWEITGDYKGNRLSFVVLVETVSDRMLPTSPPSKCSERELLAVLKSDDPAYDEATALKKNLNARGLLVSCVLQSKLNREFEGQKGAALFKTDKGDFEALFLPRGRVFAIRPIEKQDSGRYLYYLEGAPSLSFSHTWDSARRIYFVQHLNQLCTTSDERLASSLDKALNSR